MNFALSEEQRLWRDGLRSFLASRAGGAAEGALWRALADELGLARLLVGRREGGLGRGPIDAMLVMEELGAHLAAGPFLETAVVGAGLLAGSGGREAELGRLAAGGERYAFAWAEPAGRYRPGRVAARAERSGGGWRLRGAKSAVAGAPDANWLVVTARTAGEVDDPEGVSLFLVDPSLPGVGMAAFPTVDGRRAGHLSFDVVVPADAILGREGAALPLVEEVADRAVAALCAEAVGIARALLRLTVEHAGARRQFGRPLSEFQALQHRMADMAVRIETARAAACLAALRLGAEPASRARAVSAARVAAGEALRFVGQNAVQIHGGSGMAAEAPVGRFFRRATALEGEYGTTDHHLSRLVALGRGGVGVNLDLTDEERTFVAQVRRFFATDYPQDVLARARGGGLITREDHVRAQRALQARGWLGFGWPSEHGGPGWTPSQRYLFERELERAGAPALISMSIVYIGPIICAFGTPEQQERWLPDILHSRAMWAQGYSEPEAGSDLAGLRMAAVRDGDDYVLDGTKMWTSRAHWADWIFCLVRTSCEERRQDGLSLVCVPMTAPGIAVEAIPSIDGTHELNRVTFDGVRTPVANRIGEEGRGWHYANVLLANERLSYAHVGRKQGDLAQIRRRAAALSGDTAPTMLEEPGFARRLAASEAEVMVFEVAVLRALTGEPDRATVSALKILSTEAAQRITELWLELAGPHRAILPDRGAEGWADALPEAWRFAPAAMAGYLFGRAQTIFGGATEIQRNIIWRELARGAALRDG